MTLRSVPAVLAALCLVLVLSACGGGGGGSSPPPASGGGGGGGSSPPPASGGGGGGGNSNPPLASISGTVSAPGGTIAFNRATGLRSMLAELFLGRPALAGIPGLGPVAGATVELIEIDSNGAQVGPALSSATTGANGGYSLATPAGFAPAAKFVIRASGTAGNRLDAMVTGGTVDVDPATDATRSLAVSALVGGGSIARVTTAEVTEIQDTVEGLLADVNTVGAGAAAFSEALRIAATDNEEANNIVTSIAGAGEINGTVTNAAMQPLAGINVVVRDFGNWVTRTVGRTDALGHYAVKVPPGDYIVGTVNRTVTSDAASEWWTSSGGAVKQLGAEKVTVGTAPVTRNFELAPGGRISGTVTAQNGGAPLRGVQVKVRDFLSNQSVVAVKTASDGSYRVNLAPGSYFLIFENATLQPAATELFNDALNGGASFGEATRLDVKAGGMIVADASLQIGFMISGMVTDPAAATPVPVAGIRVRFEDADDGEHATIQRTDRNGRYRLWLRPGKYMVLARGQSADVDARVASQTANFTAAVGEVRMVLTDAGGKPASQVKAHLRNIAGDIVSKEASNSDGTVSVYSTASANHLLELKIDSGLMIGSTIYSDKTRLSSGDLIAVPGDLGTIMLPAGGVLSGKVTLGGVAKGEIRVQVRNGNTGNGARFVQTRTQSDGTYSISLPAGTYSRICAVAPGESSGTCPSERLPTTGDGFAFVDNQRVEVNKITQLDFAIP
jgi:5-hydroxyisourate hydrolase-like protein (transthyretin family)